jgi:hypothetical protein
VTTGSISLLALAIGAFLPWVSIEDDGNNYILRLGLFAIEPTRSDRGHYVGLHGAGDVLFFTSFVVFDLATVLALFVVLGFLVHRPPPRSLGNILAALLGLCVLGAGATTGLFARVETGHWSAYVVWAVGALLACFLASSATARAWATSEPRAPIAQQHAQAVARGSVSP